METIIFWATGDGVEEAERFWGGVAMSLKASRHYLTPIPTPTLSEVEKGFSFS